MTWLVFYAYLGFLGALSVVTMFRGNREMKRTILVIIANCAISYAYSTWIDSGEGLARFMVAIDAISAFIIVYHPAAKWQAVIGLTFILQIAAHIGRIAAQNPDILAYGWGLTIVAFVQLLLVAGWWGHAELARYYGRRSDYQMAVEPRRPSLGG